MAAIQKAGSAQAVTSRQTRPYSVDWNSIETLIGHETNDSLRIDARMPRSLLYAVAAAFLDGVQRGSNPTAASILAGPYGAKVREAFENCCDECTARKTPRVLLPLMNVANNPLKQIVADLFKDPVAVSQKLSKPAVPYELQFVGKDHAKVSAAPAGTLPGKA